MTAARIGTSGAIAGRAVVVIAPLGHRIRLLPLAWRSRSWRSAS